MKRYSVCNLNFHSSVGGTQHTLSTVLTLLSHHFNISVLDPMINGEFRSLLAQNELEVHTLHDLSRFPQLSHRRGWRRAIDGSYQLPSYTAMAWKLRKFIIRENIDVLYVNQTKSAISAIISAPPRIPIVYHCHGVTAKGFQTIVRFQYRLNQIIANSPYTCSELVAAGVSPTQISVATNTPPLVSIRAKAHQPPNPRLPSSNQGPIILVAHAGIEPNKGTHLAVAAFASLAKEGYSGQLWITGEEPPAHADYVAAIKAQIDEASVSGDVHFLGRRSDIYAVMDQADIVVVPSLVRESYGRVAAEAMILGKAVIVSTRGNLPNLIRDGITGMSFDPAKNDDLFEKLLLLIRDPCFTKKLGINARHYADNTFLMAKYESELLQAFGKIVNLDSSLDSAKILTQKEMLPRISSGSSSIK